MIESLQKNFESAQASTKIALSIAGYSKQFLELKQELDTQEDTIKNIKSNSNSYTLKKRETVLTRQQTVSHAV